MSRLCLNGIVKNESARIERMLASVLPYISAYVLTDTGSTDDTIEKILNFFTLHGIPGIVNEAPFVDWSQARNHALRSARLHAPAWDCDYLLLCDADMELKVLNPHVFAALTAPSIDMYQKGGTMEYLNRRLARVDTTGEYVGVTHEYLNIEPGDPIPLAEAYFDDHADGANRPEKFKRDIRLLQEGLRKEPDNARYFFYLAQSYRDAGKPEQAIKWYKRRVDAGGWDEERWYAQFSLAMCYRDQKKDASFVCEMLKAYNMRPSRAESLYQLANHARLGAQNASAVMFSEAAIRTPPSTDALFVDKFCETIGPLEEFGICGFYVEARRADAAKVTDRLTLMSDAPAGTQETARKNMYWYLPALKDVCPSFDWQKIDFQTEPNWTALNPSVTNYNGVLKAIIRTVNYKMDEDGRYLIADTNGEANDSNPINTRNFLVNFNPDSLTYTPTGQVELLPPGNMPAPLFKPVIGFEDMRLFSRASQLWTSSCVREMNAEGYCEQVLVPIEQCVGSTILGTEWTRMLKEPRHYEKNWMPIVGLDDHGHQMFMYRLGEVCRDTGETTVTKPTGRATGNISGSSQVIRYLDGWLAIVHEARGLPDKDWKRYYYHRFVFFDFDFTVRSISPAFYFNDKAIEFCAGLCWHPDGKRLVISYGWQDKEARIATVDHREVDKLLWFANR